jgi:hypothetical protein
VPLFLRPEQRQHAVALAWRGLRRLPGGFSLAALSRALSEESAYQAWIAGHDATLAALDAQRAAPPEGPLLSLLMPVYDAPGAPLDAAIASLLAQTYPRWELLAADGGPRGCPGSRLLARRAGCEPRIRIVALEANRGMAGNANAALAAARGEFVALFDQDDLLAPDALHALVSRLLAEPGLDLVYSDKDNVTPWGERYAPFRKPDWSPETLLSVNYLAHLALLRRSLVEALGGCDSALDGAQDWDLYLRLAERTARIAHVPRVLYHWRSLPTSCASSLAAKPYAREAQRRAVQAALDRRRIAGRASVNAAGLVRIEPRLERWPRLSVLPLGRVGQVPGAAEYGDVELASSVEAATGELLLAWDPRARPRRQSWLRVLAFWALQDGVGAVAPLVLDARGRVAEAGLAPCAGGEALPLFAGCEPDRWSPEGLPIWYRNVPALGPLAVMARRERWPGAAGSRRLLVPTAIVVV